MKIIHIKDPHLRLGFRNTNRINYDEDVKEKLESIAEYAKKHEIEYIFISGDIFDSSNERNWNVRQIYKNIEMLSILSETAKIYSIPGNHDYFHGHRTIDGTVYQLAMKMGVIHDLDGSRLDLGKYHFYGIGYEFDLNEFKKKVRNIEKDDVDGFKIILFHQNVTSRLVKNITELSYADLEKYKIDGWLCGHYHAQDKKQLNPLISNPWNLIRVTRTYEVEFDKHEPQFSVIELEDDGIRNIEYVNAKFKKYEEAFTEDAIKIMKMIAQSTDDLKIDLSKLESLKTETELDDETIVNEIIKQHKFDERVFNRVMKLLNK